MRQPNPFSEKLHRSLNTRKHQCTVARGLRTIIGRSNIILQHEDLFRVYLGIFKGSRVSKLINPLIYYRAAWNADAV